MQLTSEIRYKCFKPQLVKTRSNGYVLTSCGVCSACQIIKGERIAQKASEVCQDFKYNYLFTATYDDEHLPYYEECYIGDEMWFVSNRSNYPPIRYSDLVEKYGIGYVDLKFHTLRNGKKVLPFADFYDISNSFKKFNDRFNKRYGYTQRQFFYFFANDYGYKNGRPHFHGIISTDHPDLIGSFSEEISTKIWTLGKYNIPTSRGLFQSFQIKRLSEHRGVKNATSYVAKYISFSHSSSKLHSYVSQ